MQQNLWYVNPNTIDHSVITARVRSAREGNVYTWECLSVHMGVPTLDRGYSPWMGGGGVPSLDAEGIYPGQEGYLP